MTPDSETLPSTNPSSKSKLLQNTPRNSDDDSTQIGASDTAEIRNHKEIPLAALYIEDGGEEECSNETNEERHPHFQDDVEDPEACSSRWPPKRKSISFAETVDSSIRRRSSVADSDFGVLNQVIAQQTNKKTSLDSVKSAQSALGRVKCSIFLNILPWRWRWKCFKRKKRVARSHSIAESVSSDTYEKYHVKSSVVV
ncbi:unnamed protein product [Callosobruchus maculatus]|nr:unnamed protein product [Callosobruchus maculatus]